MRWSVMAGAVVAASAAASAHETGFLIYQDEATGALRIDFGWDHAHHVDDTIVGIPGWTASELSFEEIIDDPHEPHAEPHRVPIAAGAKIQAVFTHFDTGVFAYHPSDMMTALGSPGETLIVGTGGSDFDQMVVWRVDPSIPGYDHHQHDQHVSFYIEDITGVHGDSPVYTLKLHPAPAPGAGAAVGIGLVMMGRRRRGKGE